MAGKKGRSGGARKFAGRRKNSVRAAEDRRAFALAAAQHTQKALDTLVELMLHAKNESVRLMAAKRILDRAIGKPPMTVDITALRHDEIVYETPQQILKALIEERGVPPILIEHLSEHLRDITKNCPTNGSGHSASDSDSADYHEPGQRKG
jgi:hypothetical protein